MIVVSRLYERQFDLVTFFLTPYDPISNLSDSLSRLTFWSSLWTFGQIIVTSGMFFQDLTLKSDLLFDPTWLIIKIGQDYVKTNILRKFEEEWVKSVVSSMLTSFFQVLT